MAESPLQIELSGERLALYQALFRRSERIARMYLGAHHALRDSVNPERFTTAAHCVRELMEKVPEIVAVSTPAHSERLGSKVAELEQSFHRVVSNSKLKPPKWEGETDSPIRDFLEKMKNFFEWKKEHVPRRRHEIASTMRALDGPGRVIPSDLEKIAVEEWLDVKDYFVNVAHHQTPDPSGEDFDGHLTSLERILLRLQLVRPRREPLTACPVPHVAGAHPVASLSSGCRDRRTRHRDCDADCGAAHRGFGHEFSTVRNSRAIQQSGG